MAAENVSSSARSKAFEQNIMEHMDTLYSVALRLTRNATDAQDLLQDAVVRALRFHHKFQEGTYLKAWLLTILRNTFINDYRKKARRPTMVEWTGLESVGTLKADPEMGFYPRELKARNVLELLGDDVRHAVDALPEGHRRTVIMADLQDMSYREIADEMDCPLGTVMSRLHRGRRLLRESLEACKPQLALN
jgi:RNA polymerase sigma-70 factor (ECF subfamily)